MRTLDQLGLKYGTDKASSHHNYCKVYDSFFSPLRDKTFIFLELGYGGHEDPHKGGESVHMWHEYFPKVKIACVDNEAKLNIPLWLRLFTCSQDDEYFLESAVNMVGRPTIVIDDASHLSSLTIKSFEILFPLLKSGGFYCVEDLHQSYHSHFYGEIEANENPAKGKTAMNYFKRLCDEVNKDLIDPEYHLGYDIEWMHFSKDLLIIKKK